MATGTRHGQNTMEDHLKLLSRDLDASLRQEAPEEHIKRALQAHGFFNHQKRVDDKPCAQVKENDKAHGITEEDRRRTTQLISQVKEGKEFHTLREPWNLKHNYGGPIQPAGPRWPIELECLPVRLKFITDPPPQPEPLCLPVCTAVAPKVRSTEEEGEVVYHNQPVHAKCFTSARTGQSLKLTMQPPIEADSTTLIFESRFESGNLEKVVKVGPWDYELLLRGDLYTKKHTQWFFFRVQNMREGQTYRFTIINLYKDSSLYNKGMQPVFYSEADAKSQKLGWRRAGHSIKYFKSPARRPSVGGKESYFYCLTWAHTFEHARDTCFFAHCYPYTYSDMLDDLRAVQTDPQRAPCCKQRTLCHTLAGNMVPVLTITSPAQSHDDHKVHDLYGGNEIPIVWGEGRGSCHHKLMTECKKAVVVTARVHPGETNSSWMMKGVLEYLTGQSPDAKMLRELFVFKVVPMLNPDGVIAGNYRCSLAGRDLNRNYRSKLKNAYPSVWHTKAMVKRLSEEREIVLYCDLHGHSKKQNVFIYGCDNNEDKANRLCGRVFAKMLSMNAPSKFSYESSKFTVHKSKLGTGRVYMWRELGVANSYTMEATFCGSLLGKQSGHHFNTADLEAMGRHLCDTLLDYCDPDQSKVQQVLRDVEEDYRSEVLARLAAMGRAVPEGVDPLDIILEPEGTSDSGSDSSVSDGPPLHVAAPKKKKRKKLKSRKERNKHKALLKMTQKLAPIAVPQGPVDQVMLPSLGHKPGQGSGSQLTSSCHDKEGGGEGDTPAFLQEQRHRLFVQMHSDGIPDATTQERYIETVTQDYAKQTLLPGPATLSGTLCDGATSSGGGSGGLHETSRLLQNSTSFLARLPALPTLPPLCTLVPLPLPPSPYTYSHPINILPMALLDQKRGAAAGRGGGSLVSLQGREEGKRTSSTAELLTNASCRTAFASQYVATYLSELVSSGTATNNSRNLSNLSQMFRHLYPQASRPVHPDSKKSPSHPPPPLSQPTPQTDAGRLFSDPSTGQQVDQPPPQHSDPPTHPDKAPLALPPSKKSPRHLAVPLSSSDLSVSGPQTAKPRLSPKDKRLIADIRSSYNGSSLHDDSTTSWESFVQPAKILPKDSSGEVGGVALGMKELHLEWNQAGPVAELDGTADASGLAIRGGVARTESGSGRQQQATVSPSPSAGGLKGGPSPSAGGLKGGPSLGAGGLKGRNRADVSSSHPVRAPGEGVMREEEPPCGVQVCVAPLSTITEGSVAAHKKGVAEALQGIHLKEETAAKECKSFLLQSRWEQSTRQLLRNRSPSTMRAEPSSLALTRVISSHPAAGPNPAAHDGVRTSAVNLTLADISPHTARRRHTQVRYFTKRNYLKN